MRLLLALGLLLLVGCARDNQRSDVDGGLDFVIGDIPFQVSSGAARVEGGALGLFLTDQPDGCLAITQLPAGMAAIFELHVAARDDGTLAATVVGGAGTPAPGQARGAIRALSAGSETARHDAVSGEVTWAANAGGTYTIQSLDVGFDGTSDRLVTGGLTVPACN